MRYGCWSRAPLIAAAVSIGCVGCTTAAVTQMAVNSPTVLKQLQLVSAGHTGCLPDDNRISIVFASADGSGLWKATCNGQTYICSAVGTAERYSTYSCAREVAQASPPTSDGR